MIFRELARDANHDAVEMASSMVEELADWLDEGDEAEDYQREIEELAEEVCERFNDDAVRSCTSTSAPITFGGADAGKARAVPSPTGLLPFPSRRPVQPRSDEGAHCLA